MSKMFDIVRINQEIARENAIKEASRLCDPEYRERERKRKIKEREELKRKYPNGFPYPHVF